jgi:hypothetical protein
MRAIMARNKLKMKAVKKKLERHSVVARNVQTKWNVKKECQNGKML